MIRNIHISAAQVDDDIITEPPSRILDLAVIGGVAHLATYELSGPGVIADEATAAIEVPARSLLLALQAAIDDDAS
jgi:hypothetical protein